jgi:ferredoxin
LIALLGRKYEWTMEPADLDNLVQMSRLAFQPEVGQHPGYTVPLEYIACISSLPYHREGKKFVDLDTAICLHTVALLEIKRDWPLNLQRRRALLKEVGSLLDDRWKLKGEVRDGYGADEADVERAQIESILPLLGDGTRPLAQCGVIGTCATYTSRVTGEHRMVSGFRKIFRRTLKEGEEREESDVWSSSLPDVSDSEARSVHSGDERSVDLDHIADDVSQEELSAKNHDKLQETGNEELD